MGLRGSFDSLGELGFITILTATHWCLHMIAVWADCTSEPPDWVISTMAKAKGYTVTSRQKQILERHLHVHPQKLETVLSRCLNGLVESGIPVLQELKEHKEALAYKKNNRAKAERSRLLPGNEWGTLNTRFTLEFQERVVELAKEWNIGEGALIGAAIDFHLATGDFRPDEVIALMGHLKTEITIPSAKANFENEPLNQGICAFLDHTVFVAAFSKTRFPAQVAARRVVERAIQTTLWAHTNSFEFDLFLKSLVAPEPAVLVTLCSFFTFRCRVSRVFPCDVAAAMLLPEKASVRAKIARVSISNEKAGPWLVTATDEFSVFTGRRQDNLVVHRV